MSVLYIYIYIYIYITKIINMNCSMHKTLQQYPNISAI